MKIPKKKNFERRSEAFVKIKKKIWGLGEGRVQGGGGGHNGCKQRIEAFVKIAKKIVLGRGGEGRVRGGGGGGGERRVLGGSGWM